MRLLLENNQLKYNRGSSYFTNTIIQLYTAIVMLQFYSEESFELHHI